MGKLKKISALFIAIVISLSMTSCSLASWSFKTSDDTLSAGTYIMYMSRAYSTASTKVENSSTDVLKQTIDGQKASDYIKDEAKASCEKLLGLEKKFTELNLSLTDEETEQATQSTEQIWSYYGKSYEKLGISKDSFHRAYTLYNLKYEKVFDAIYGTDGTTPVSDEELKNYFCENFVSGSYITKSASVTDDTSTDVSEETENIKNHFESYAQSINHSEKSFKDAVTQYMSDFSVETDPTVSKFVNPNSEYADSSFPDESILESLKNLEINKAESIQTDNSAFYLVYKENPEDKYSTLSDDEKKTVLLDMKSDEFDNMLKETAESNNLKTNYIVIMKYQPSMFNKSK